ncbi:MAG: L-ribulose-5-phosphate 3-epimerase [Planctomycetota bacterium]|jgi:L-ribulose-5-phosphate 3-epimerase
MINRFSRRSVLSAGLGLALAPRSAFASAAAKDELFGISLAQWSLHRTIGRGELDAFDFPKHAKEAFGISAVEYVSSFYSGMASDFAKLRSLKQRVDDCGSKSLLIMVDGEGHLGDSDESVRDRAVEQHFKWIAAARFLGCHAIRVNAHGDAEWAQRRDLAANSLARLGRVGDEYQIDVIVENHGGLSSNGKWLSETIVAADHPRVGTLPDFGNFRIQGDEWYDRYQGIEELMPHARAVSAKSNEFIEDGSEKHTDYERMLRIVLDAGYRGHVGIEFEGGGISEAEGIRATKVLLERVRAKLTPEYS